MNQLHHIRDHRREYMIAFSGSMATFASAAALAWVSPMMPALKGKNSPIPMTGDEANLMVLAVFVGQLVAVAASPWIMERFSRKWFALAGGVPLLLGWIALALAPSLHTLYALRLATGITLGIVQSVMPIYLSEICQDESRASVCNVQGAMAALGICYSFALGPMLTLQQMIYAQLVPIIGFLASFPLCSESPRWLLCKSRDDEARETLRLLRGEHDVETEFALMEDELLLALDPDTLNERNILKVRNRFVLMTTLGMAAGTVLIGTDVAFNYSHSAYKLFAMPLTSSDLSMIAGFVLAVTAIATWFISDRVPRWKLMLASVGGIFVSNAALATCWYMRKTGVSLGQMHFVPMIAFVLLMLSYGIGMVMVTFAGLTDITPKHLQSMASCCFGATSAVLGMGMMKAYQTMAASADHYCMYAMFAGSAAIFIPFIWFYVSKCEQDYEYEQVAIGHGNGHAHEE